MSLGGQYYGPGHPTPLVIVYLVIVEFFVIVDRLCRPIVYFSMYFSRNSGITRYSGHFATDGRIHYYERRLYLLNPLRYKNVIYLFGKPRSVVIMPEKLKGGVA